MIVIDCRMSRSSGIGTYIRNLLPRVMSCMHQEHFVLFGDIEELKALADSVSERVKMMKVQAPIYSIKEQLEIVSKIPPDAELFWCPHYNIPLLYRGRVLVTVHDVFHLAMPHLTGGIHKRFYARIMFEAVTRKAKGIICVSRSTTDELVRFTKVNRNKLAVIHNGVNISRRERTENASPHGKPYLLFVGNVKPHKNLCRLLEAFGMLMGEITHDLVIVGRKEGFITQDDRVKKLARELGGRVIFTGEVETDLLLRYYLHAETLLFPSLYEGFGLPPLEAMACGCSVITSAIPPLEEICADAALYCDPYSARDIAIKIELLLNDAKLRGSLIEKGRLRAKNFSWGDCAAKTAQFIEEVLRR